MVGVAARPAVTRFKSGGGGGAQGASCCRCTRKCSRPLRVPPAGTARAPVLRTSLASACAHDTPRTQWWSGRDHSAASSDNVVASRVLLLRKSIVVYTYTTWRACSACGRTRFRFPSRGLGSRGCRVQCVKAVGGEIPALFIYCMYIALAPSNTLHVRLARQLRKTEQKSG